MTHRLKIAKVPYAHMEELDPAVEELERAFYQNLKCSGAKEQELDPQQFTLGQFDDIKNRAAHQFFLRQFAKWLRATGKEQTGAIVAEDVKLALEFYALGLLAGVYLSEVGRASFITRAK